MRPALVVGDLVGVRRAGAPQTSRMVSCVQYPLSADSFLLLLVDLLRSVIIGLPFLKNLKPFYGSAGIVRLPGAAERLADTRRNSCF